MVRVLVDTIVVIVSVNSIDVDIVVVIDIIALVVSVTSVIAASVIEDCLSRILPYTIPIELAIILYLSVCDI